MATVAASLKSSLVTLGSFVPPVKTDSAPKPAHAIADEALFDDALKGNRDALGTLVSRYEKSLFGLLVRMCDGDRDRADDLFQETFLHAMRASVGGTFDRTRRFKPYLTAIAVNLVRDDARKRKVRSEVALDTTNRDDAERGDPCRPEPMAAGEFPDELAERQDEEACVRRALGTLTEYEREVVLLHFFNRMTLQETAEILGIPLGTVKSRLHLALTRLGEVLSPELQRS